jgi:hypothetical protein
MNAVYFLKMRTSFIRFFYEEGVKPFRNIQQKIELGEYPFDNPPYSEDPEPAFTEQWGDAETAVAVLGQTCISILFDTLKLYFQSLGDRVIGFSLSEEGKAIAKKQGFVAAYKAVLGQILETDWVDSAVCFDVIEQVVLARNRSQHGSSLTSFHIAHDGNALKKHPRPFFASDIELQTWNERGGDVNSLFLPALEVTPNKLFSAIEEAERLADWIESRMGKVWEWRQNAASK